MLTNQSIQRRYLFVGRPDLRRVHLAPTACPAQALCGFSATDMEPAQVQAGDEARACTVCLAMRADREREWAKGERRWQRQ